MATITIDDTHVHIRFSRFERIAGLLRDRSIPLLDVTAVSARDRTDLRGLRAPGTSVPGLLRVGTWRRRGRRTIVALRRGDPVLHLETDGKQHRTFLLSTPDAELLVRRLGTRRAGPADVDAAVRTLVESHLDAAWEDWAVPGDDRERRLDALYRSDLTHLGLPHGEVWTTAGHEAVAVWLPAGARARLDAGARAALERTAADALGERLVLVERADAEVARRRPAAEWHLATMGTRPPNRRRGWGTAVLRPALDRLDARGERATLETSDPGNLVFYGRLGFVVVDHVPSVDGAPGTWIMERSPRATG